MLFVAALAVACGPPPNSDCGNSSTSPIDVSLEGAAAKQAAGDFSVTARGSKGDTPTVAFSAAELNALVFQGQGQSDETYKITVTFKGSVVFDETVSWSVDGCGFWLYLDPASCSDAGAGGAQCLPLGN